jgi:hypothetical protein
MDFLKRNFNFETEGVLEYEPGVLAGCLYFGLLLAIFLIRKSNFSKRKVKIKKEECRLVSLRPQVCASDALGLLIMQLDTGETLLSLHTQGI